jgi:signal transduction histidine kinase/ligand-binding sensor domain-containing protein
MRKLAKFLCIFIFLFMRLGISGYGDDFGYRFKQITYENGLPGNNLRTQIQDHLGIMWLSVEAMGVCRYDGNKFTEFRNNPNDSTTISSNFVNFIIEDKDHMLWFASENGLSQFDRSKIAFKQFHPKKNNPNSLPSEQCNTIFIDSKNRMWVGTGNGLALYNPDKNNFINYLNLENTSISEHQIVVNAIIEYPEGVFWLGCNKGLIQFSERQGIINSWKKDGLSSEEPIYNTLNVFTIDKQDQLWIGTHQGLDRFDLKTERFNHWNYKPEDESVYQTSGINSLLLDSDSILWVSTYVDGIVLINTISGQYNIIKGKPGMINTLNSNHIKYIYNDRDNNKWACTKFDGLFKLEKRINQFDKWPQRLEKLKEISSKYIYSFYEDQDSLIWVGSKLEGLFRVDLKAGTIKQFMHDPANIRTVSSNRIQSIFRDSKGRLWIGTMRGLDYFDDLKNSIVRVNSKLIINVLFEDHEKRFWVGTNTGLYLLDRTSLELTLFSHPGNSSLSNNNALDIYQMMEDKNHNLWISTRTTGLFVIWKEQGKITHFEKKDTLDYKSININMTRALFEDSKGNIWIGTKAGGLNKFNPSSEKFEYFGLDDGLPSELILGIREDKHGYLWIGTHNGISKFNPEKKEAFNFNSDAGLKSNIIEPGAVCSFAPGELLFGGNDGFNVFYPDDINPIYQRPKVLINTINVFNKPILQDISGFEEIELSYKQNYITIDFIELDYKNPYRHEYAYILEGFDKDWIYSGSRNFISYNGLRPGKYLFKVRAANEFGNWSENNPEIVITIHPPYYKTIWFQSLSIFTLFLIIFIVYIQNSRRIKKREMELEKLVQERTFSLKSAVNELSQKNEVISQQKNEIEQHQVHLEQKVTERTHDLEIAKQKAEEADKLKSSFLANMSHEIRTPLNAICGFSSLLNDDDLDKNTRQTFIDLISSNSAMLLKLIEDILDISKIEAHQLTINKEKFNLNELIVNLHATFLEEIKNQNIHEVELICRNLDPKQALTFMYSDQYRIKQILLNLLGNALKFCRQGSIEFGYSDKNSAVLFFVKDTGIGIPTNNIDIIFNRFIKIEDKKVMYRGTGLGLSISQSIVQLLGGKIWVESIEGKGSTFSFILPKGLDEIPDN